MLKIRLDRIGRKKLPIYRIVAIESSSTKNGRPVAYLGTFNPISKDLKMDIEGINKHIKNGAQVSERVGSLIKNQNKNIGSI